MVNNENTAEEFELAANEQIDEETAEESESAADEQIDEETAERFDNMDTAEFKAYLDNIKNGSVGKETAEESELAADSSENTAERSELAADVSDATANDSKQGEDDAVGANSVRTEGRLFTQADVDRIIHNRLSERSKSDREVIDLFDAVSSEAARFYGMDGAEAVRKMLDDLKAQNADAMGMNGEQYGAMRETEEKARLYDEEQKKKNTRQEEINEIQKRWEEQTEEVRSIAPDFDFEKAMGNKAFYDAIMQGKSVQTAYLISKTAVSGNDTNAAKPVRRNIKQNAASVNTPAGNAEFDPVKASDKDFNDYINKIKRQEF